MFVFTCPSFLFLLLTPVFYIVFLTFFEVGISSTASSISKVVPLFANLSAISFPKIPMCDLTQLILTRFVLANLFSCILHVLTVLQSIIYLFNALIAACEST